MQRVSEDNRDDRRASTGEPAIISRYYIPLHNLSILLRKIISGLPNQERNKVILDIGCGYKPYQPFFTGQYSSYIGVDISTKTLCDVKASGDRLPFRDRVFDLCICTQTYEHMVDPRQVTREVHRVLKETGFFILSTHAVAPIHDYPGDYWRWTNQGLRVLLGEYFSSIVVHDVTTPLETISQIIVSYLPMNLFGNLSAIFMNKIGVFIGKNRINRKLPRLIGLYLVIAEKTGKQ